MKVIGLVDVACKMARSLMRPKPHCPSMFLQSSDQMALNGMRHRLNRLMPRLFHDDELPHSVHRRLGHASVAKGVPAERINIHSGPSCSSLQELSNRVFVQAALRDMSIAAD